MSLLKPISFFVENQLPEFIRSDLSGKYDNFVSFIKAYYEWLEQENGVTTESRNLLSYADIDKTTDEFINYFVYKFLPNFPQEIVNDKAKIIKSIDDFYSKKGSYESVKFLFRIIFNEDVDVFYPKGNILKISDGKWRIPQTFRLTVENTPNTFDLSRIKKRKAIGRISKATCVIESAYRTIDVGTGAEIIEVYVSNVNRLFDNGEYLDVQYIDDNGNQNTLLSERIIGSLSNIKIDPKNRGLKYAEGNPVVLIGGLSNDITIATQEAKAIVSEVTDGRIQTAGVIKGGFGFRINPNTEVDVINAPGDTTGANASVEVTEIINEIPFRFNIDSIQEYSALVLNAANYGFPNTGSSTINTTLDAALTFNTVNVGTISKVVVDNPGNKYLEVPTLYVNSFYDTSNSENYFNEVISVLNEDYRDEWEATRQNFLDLGKIANVSIVSGGSGYNTATDKIYVNRNGGGGYGANITFTTTSGVITGVTLVDGGEGYNGPKNSLELIVANSSNIYASSAGTGAVIKALRYGEGDDLTSTVEDVGRIKKFKLLSRGSGYVSKPTVSMKIVDVGVTSINTPIGSFIEVQRVYQGPSSSPTFTANVDLYVSGDSSSGVIRLYNYQGTLALSSNLTIDSSPSYNVTATSNTYYGNGLARADAEFLNGLIKYNGYYLNTDGFLSSDKKLQDKRKYHNFSYVITTEKSLKEYKNLLMDILHPIGTKMLGSKQVKDVIGSGFGFN